MIKVISAEEAAGHISHGMNVGFSGFTAAGSPKAVATAVANNSLKAKENGGDLKIKMFTGASTGDLVDGVLARANAVEFRTPYQSNSDMRKAINNGNAKYVDYHLSQLAQDLRYGFFGKIDVAIIEVADFNEAGELVLTSGVGIAPTICQLADKIILEHNATHPKELKGFHDLYQPLDPPYRKEIPIYKPNDRIGSPILKVDPTKIVGVVETNIPDEVGGFSPVDEVTAKIGENVANFLADEIKAGRIPKEFLPIQSGVGNIANAVLGSLGQNPDIPSFEMYTEVIQDAVISLMKEGNCKFASGCSLTVSKEVLKEVYSDLDFFRDKIVLRPGELTNNPELVRRMGLITINTALEVDIFGNVNSTHVVGSKMMNGIGGSGDFTRNAYLSIFTTPAVAKGGKISAFVPMVSHLDHSEHSVNVIISEYGVADLRGKSPIERANCIIDHCVDPKYQPLLRNYLKLAAKGQTPHNLKASLEFHIKFEENGDMGTADWGQYQ